MDTDTIVKGRLYTANETMGFLAIKRSKFYELVSSRSIGTVRIGSALRFKGHDILKFIEMNRDMGRCR